MKLRAAALLSVLISTNVFAQTREQGPWWPHPLWGAEDQAGATNWITPDKILQSVQLVTTGRLFELGQVYEKGMPVYGGRTYSMIIPGWPTAFPMGTNKLVGHDEFVCAEIGQVGTQFDGPGHIGAQMTMADGSTEYVFYNGFTKSEMGSDYGLEKLGIENVKPIVTRGILIDIAGLKQTRRLDNSYEVTLADVRAALEKQRIDEASIQPGDAIFFRYGWSQLWGNPDAYNDNPPGIGLEVARWVIEKQATMVGSDSWTTEVVPSPEPDLAFPVHQELITKNGVFNLENMRFEELAEAGVNEFLFILAPIPFKGGTGSPGRPIAIR